MRDEITLTIPRQEPFYGIARLVLGGLAVRLNLTFESLEDLQLALDGLLEQEQSEGDVTVALSVADDVIGTAVGPFDGAALRAALEPDSADELGLRRILLTVADGFELEERSGGHWIELTKSIRRANGPEA